MIYKIPIHSFIDVITNSSTEIYVSTHDKSIELMKEFINEIMKSTGHPFEFDDYFEIYIEKDEHYDDFGTKNLMIKSKNKEAENLNHKMSRIFDIFECYG